MSREFTVQGVGVAALAEEFGTPLYLYDGDDITARTIVTRRLRSLGKAADQLVFLARHPQHVLRAGRDGRRPRRRRGFTGGEHGDVCAPR